MSDMTHKQSALEEFNEEYKIVRAQVLKGKFSVSTARMWLEKHGAQAAVKLQSEFTARSERMIAQRADRELDVLRKMEEEDKNDE
jgi:hypothetical protein